MKKVSVIVPAYNVEEYICRCIESLIAQTYGELDIIVVDDGSYDMTPKIVDAYAKKDGRIKVIHKENGGVSSARNRGLEKAGGEYVFFLDGDDVAEEDAVETLMNCMGTQNCDLAACEYSRWDENGNRLEDYHFVEGVFTFNAAWDRMRFILDELMAYRVGFEVWDKMYRADLIRKGGVLFNTECRIGEDLGFNIKYLLNSAKVVCVANRCVRHSIRSGSAMDAEQKLSREIVIDLSWLKDVSDYLEQRATEHKEMAKAFPLLFLEGMDHAYAGHSSHEIVCAFSEIEDIRFVVRKYSEAFRRGNGFMRVHRMGKRWSKIMRHISVRKSIGAGRWTDAVLLKGYDLYRKRKRSSTK
ncbi:MAG: glycosyltransferase family 2 protein [bacterium]